MLMYNNIKKEYYASQESTPNSVEIEMINILYILFHEYRHSTQNNIIFDLETTITTKNFNFYTLNHDSFLFEIDANMYAIMKTEEILKKCNLLNETSIEKINNIKRIIFQQYADYDIRRIIGIIPPLLDLFEMKEFNNQSKELQSIYIINSALLEESFDKLELSQKYLVLETLQNELEQLETRKKYISQIIDDINYTNLEQMTTNIKEKIENLNQTIEQEENKNTKKH